MGDSMKKGGILISAIAALILGNSFFIPTDDVHFIWERFPLSGAILGFVGCLVLIAVTKLVVKRLIQRDEGYYD